jgi:hypothetical protein
MRRFTLSIFATTAFATIAIVATSAACAANAPSTGPSSAAATSSAAPAGDDTAACATAKSARDSILNDLILAFVTVGDEESSAADVSQAAKDLVNAYTVLADGMSKAAGQAATPALKDALNAYANGSRQVLAKITAAGVDRAKLDAAIDDPGVDAAEKTVTSTCT